MPIMHSNLGEVHPGKTRILREPRHPAVAKVSPTKLTVAFPGRSLHLELCRGNSIILSGTWEMDIDIDGVAAMPVSDYEETCWVADKDVNYLELEIQLSGGLRLERHIVFAREDQFVFLADAVFGPQAGMLNYRGLYPLASGMTFQPDRKSNEGTILEKKKLALVVPLALAEWQIEHGSEQLLMQDGKLELSQSDAGRNLFAPLFIDLKSRRFEKPLTWRQLTVAEAMATQPRDSAVGYRLMIGKEQWLIYRSLTPKANRTLLGHNLSSEFLLARFLKNGEVESLIEVE